MNNSDNHITVNIEEGFLPHFSQSFIEYYGNSSPFVLSTSDYLTSSLFNLLKGKKLLKNNKFAQFSTYVANKSFILFVNCLVEKVDKKIIAQTLMNEAFELQKLGCFGKLVNSKLGTNVFQKWYSYFNNGDFISADQLVLEIKAS